jgi:hypothetical protein
MILGICLLFLFLRLLKLSIVGQESLRRLLFLYKEDAQSMVLWVQGGGHSGMVGMRRWV